MRTALSKDGTRIAFDQSGKGPAVILVAGALGDHSHPMFEQLAAFLALHFTVINYDAAPWMFNKSNWRETS